MTIRPIPSQLFERRGECFPLSSGERAGVRASVKHSSTVRVNAGLKAATALRLKSEQGAALDFGFVTVRW